VTAPLTNLAHFEPNREPRLYFPVEQKYRFTPGLRPLGDEPVLQADCEQRQYLAAKGVPRCHQEDTSSGNGHVLDVVDRYIREHAHQDLGFGRFPQTSRRNYYGSLQEDLVIMRTDRAILVRVDIPSGWKPELILGQDFQRIHAEVPGFAKTERTNQSYWETISKRGPWERFVWMPSSVPTLDLHPDRCAAKPTWAEAEHLYLRVERQVTIPFPTLDACLFTIRVYSYPAWRLNHTQLRTMQEAIASAGPTVAEYKGWDKNGGDMLRLIDNELARRAR